MCILEFSCCFFSAHGDGRGEGGGSIPLVVYMCIFASLSYNFAFTRIYVKCSIHIYKYLVELSKRSAFFSDRLLY